MATNKKIGVSLAFMADTSQARTQIQSLQNQLNELSKNHKMIYPIASRCGVFAKTDIGKIREINQDYYYISSEEDRREENEQLLQQPRRLLRQR